MLKRGCLHSTVIGRFFVYPAPVPLQGCHLNAFFYVGHSYSTRVRVKNILCTPGLLYYRCLTRCCLRPRGDAFHYPVHRGEARGLRAGQCGRLIPKISRSRGYVSDSGHPPFTSPNSHCKQWFRAAGSTLPGKASIFSYVSFTLVTQCLIN